jgi:hypothetical protein
MSPSGHHQPLQITGILRQVSVPIGGRNRERGAALLAALCFAAVLALSLGSYITVCYRSLSLSSRTMQGTRSLELAEMGMEDALWALNKNTWTDWTIVGDNASKIISGIDLGGGTTGSISVAITNYTGASGTRTVSVTGSTTQDSKTISRTLTSSSSKAALFVNAVAGTTGRVRFRSAGTVDSYDSTIGDYTAQTPGFSAVISSGNYSTTTAPIQMTNVQIKGYTSSAGMDPSYSTSARLIGPSTPTSTKIDTSRISTSPYQPIFEEDIPSGSGLTLPSGTATIGTSGASTPTLYYGSWLYLTGSQTLTINGPVVIVLSADLYIANTARIRIASTGSLRIHVAGDITIGGGGIQNDTKLPKKCFIVSTTNPYDSYSMATNTAFYGVIYTPVSSFTVSNSQAIYGSIVAKAVTFSQSPAFHYDISLRNEVFDGIVTPFSVSNWRETAAD